MKRIAVLLLTGVLSGCLVGPDYERPETVMPDAYLAAASDEVSAANLPWWEVFADAVLTELIGEAIENNRDLRVAAARVDEARARFGVTRSGQFPTVDVGAGATRGNSGDVLMPGTGPTNNWRVGLDAAYEVDLWGRFRRATEAERAALLATDESRRTVLITLIADVASAYLLLRDLDARLDIANDTLRARQESTGIIRERFDKGIVSLLAVNQAEIEEAEAAVRIASFQRQIRETQNLLSVLVGKNPQIIMRGASIDTDLIAPRIPVGLPSDLLERRPDVRGAEQGLAAQTARIGVAQALRFPSIRLTGSLGRASDELSGFSSGTKLWGVGMDLFAPLFDAGARRSQVELEIARTEQALNTYEQTVLNALREVEDALAGIDGFGNELNARRLQVKAAESASELSRARYDGGVADYLEVLDSERSLFDAQLAASQVRRLELGSYVQLYRALGGGWFIPEDVATERAPASAAK